MKSACRVFPLLLSMLLLLGHQLVPHAHGVKTQEMSITDPLVTEAGWLGKVFNLDQGADHLEHFRPAAESESQSDFLFTTLPHTISSWVINHFQVEEQAPLVPGTVPIPLILIANAHQLRGPPSC